MSQEQAFMAYDILDTGLGDLRVLHHSGLNNLQGGYSYPPFTDDGKK